MLSIADKENLRKNKEAIIAFLQSRKQKKQKNRFFNIPRLAEAAHYQISNAQRRLWTLSQFTQGNIAYNMPGVYLIEGTLDIAALERSFDTLIARHESLRTVFREDEQGTIKQFINPVDKTGFAIEHTNLEQEDLAEPALKSLLEKELSRPFDLAAGPLLRAGLYRLANDKWIFAYVMHHIISDGWSVGVLIKELLVLYTAYLKNQPNPLPALEVQYKDYVAWQSGRLNSSDLLTDKMYWLQQFEGDLPVAELPADKVRPAIKSYNGKTIIRTLSATSSAGIHDLSRQSGCTLFMGLLASLTTLLHRYSGQEDIIIGVPVAGREHADLDDQIGFYVNTLALRMKFNAGDSYLQLLEKARQVTFDAHEHQLYPFDEMVDALHLKHDLSRNALFDVMLVLQNFSGADITGEHAGGIKINEYKGIESTISKFDMTFTFVERVEDVQVIIQYNSDIYNSDSMERMTNHLEQLLEVIIKEPAMPIGELDYLSEAEKFQLTEGFNTTSAAWPEDSTVIGLFEAQVTKTPDNIAVVFEKHHLTYIELNERANQLGNYLRSKGVRENTLVPLCIERSIEMLVAMLGILKAGGAYVPIDAEYPEERIGYMLKDTGAGIVISSKQCKVKMPAQTDFHLINIDEEWEMISSQPVSAVPAMHALHHLVYVIYTSGSTGQPKGVKMPGRPLVNLLSWQEKQFTNKCRRVLQFASMNFDVSFQEIFSTLCSGSTLYLIRAERRVDMAEIWKDISTYQLTHLFLPQMVFNNLAEYIHTLPGVSFSPEEVIVAGEQLRLTEAMLKLLREHGTRLINHYGPTETHVMTSYTVDADNVLSILPPIGKPIDNTRIYILKNGVQLVPPGVTGELYLGGICVADGYLNRPDLSEEKFISDPFRNEPGAKMYRTGDLGRWLPDGNIEFIGRIDDQVKIRGYRVELGEIETAIQLHPLVDSAVVVARSAKDATKELVAYIVSREVLNTTDLRAYLGKSLPAYMVPAYFVQLDTLPFTTNGKLNRKKLPDPEELGMSSGIEYIAPRNATEEKLVSIWQDVLGKERIGIKDNFFELGGHSLKATQLISRINKAFLVRINIQSIFNEPTIENISDHILFVLDQKNRASNKEALMEIELS